MQERTFWYDWRTRGKKVPYTQKRRSWKGQRKRRKKPKHYGYQLGGCKGRGFLPGKSANPAGTNFSVSDEITRALIARLQVIGV
jgi:hypothetical protein